MRCCFTHRFILAILVKLAVDALVVRLQKVEILSLTEDPVDRVWVSFALHDLILPLFLANAVQDGIDIDFGHTHRISG